MKISIIVPVYNEEKTLKKILKKIEEATKKFNKEIIIIDDGSIDKSKDILRRYEKKKDFRIFYKKLNEGKGSAVIKGLKEARGDIFLIHDADLEYNPKDYTKLIKPIINGKAKVVYGSRYKSKKGHLKSNPFLYNIHYFGNKLLTFFTNILYNSNLTDMETCYKAFSKDIYEKISKLKSKGFEFEPEITAKILKKGFKIKEVPISYFSRNFKEGKKITWVDGIKTFYCLLKYKFKD